MFLKKENTIPLLQTIQELPFSPGLKVKMQQDQPPVASRSHPLLTLLPLKHSRHDSASGPLHLLQA